MKPGLHRALPEAAYHADPCETPSLSASVARILIARSPDHAWTAHPRLNPAYRAAEREAFDLGHAAETLLLEGDNRMEVIDAGDYRTKAAQEARDGARAAGRYPVLPAQHAAILAMRSVAIEAISACRDLSGLTLADGRAQQTLIWRESNGIWCRSRLDWMSEARDLILDYKTTSASANPAAWVRTMLGGGGDIQPALYLRGNAATGGPENAKFLWLVQETVPPYACAFMGAHPSMLELGSGKAETAIEQWGACLKSDTWPAYPPRIYWLEAPGWAQASWEEAQSGILADPAILFGGLK